MSETPSPAESRPDWDTAALTRDEARARANALTVASYDVAVDVRNAVRKLVAVADVVRVTVLNTVDVARSVAVARAVEARPSVVVRVTVVV